MGGEVYPGSLAQSLGSITSGPLCAKLEHHGTEWMWVEQRSSPRDGWEAETDMSTLAGFLPLFQTSRLLGDATSIQSRSSLLNFCSTFHSALEASTRTHPEICFPNLPGITQPTQVHTEDLPWLYHLSCQVPTGIPKTEAFWGNTRTFQPGLLVSVCFLWFGLVCVFKTGCK